MRFFNFGLLSITNRQVNAHTPCFEQTSCTAYPCATCWHTNWLQSPQWYIQCWHCLIHTHLHVITCHEPLMLKARMYRTWPLWMPKEKTCIEVFKGRFIVFNFYLWHERVHFEAFEFPWWLHTQYYQFGEYDLPSQDDQLVLNHREPARAWEVLSYLQITHLQVYNTHTKLIKSVTFLLDCIQSFNAGSNVSSFLGSICAACAFWRPIWSS